MTSLDMVEILQRPAVLSPVVLFLTYIVYQLFFKPSNLPDLPILNAREGEWFPLWRAAWRTTLDYKAACKQAQKQFPDEACIVSQFGLSTAVLLPKKQVRFLDQPESVLSLHDTAVEDLQADYTMDAELVRHPLHPLIATLTQQTGNLVPALAEETALGLDAAWGTDTAAWRDVCVYRSLRPSIGRVTNRIFVGEPVCRDPELVRLAVAYVQDVSLGGALLGQLPGALRPLAAPAITLPNKLHKRAFLKILVPVVERRLREYDERHGRGGGKEKKAGSGSGSGPGPEPNDLLQWMIRQARESGDAYLSRPRTLALRVLILNFSSIFTSSFAITHAILDLVSSRREHIGELRDEIRAVLAEHGGQWDKHALARMEKLDSAFRESQRVNSMVTLGPHRAVVAEEGVTTPDGVYIPKGNRVCAPGYSILHDPVAYPDPDEFKPFRFSEKKRAGTREDAIGKEAAPASDAPRAPLQWASTSDDYLAWGHGRKACPGRFFAATELKLMLGHLILHYDFEMLKSRPRNLWMAPTRIPPTEQTIRVKRLQQ